MSALQIIQLIQLLAPLIQVTEPLVKGAIQDIVHAIAHAASSNKTLQESDIAQPMAVIKAHLAKGD